MTVTQYIVRHWLKNHQAVVILQIGVDEICYGTTGTVLVEGQHYDKLESPYKYDTTQILYMPTGAWAAAATSKIEGNGTTVVNLYYSLLVGGLDIKKLVTDTMYNPVGQSGTLYTFTLQSEALRAIAGKSFTVGGSGDSVTVTTDGTVTFKAGSETNATFIADASALPVGTYTLTEASSNSTFERKWLICDYTDKLGNSGTYSYNGTNLGKHQEQAKAIDQYGQSGAVATFEIKEDRLRIYYTLIRQSRRP